jgi:hypothetical protein
MREEGGLTRTVDDGDSFKPNSTIAYAPDCYCEMTLRWPLVYPLLGYIEFECAVIDDACSLRYDDFSAALFENLPY